MRKSLFYRIHTYVSLLFLIPLVLVCLSGSVLVYKDEIHAIFHPVNIAKPTQDRLNFSTLQKALNSNLKNHEITAWKIEKDRADKVFLRNENKKIGYVYLNPYNGEILSEFIPKIEGFLGAIFLIHKNLFLGKNGQILLGITALFAFVICISGFVIYQNFWKNLFLLRFKKLAVFMSDWHKFIGVFSTPILLVISLSGAWWDLRHMLAPKHKAPLKQEKQINPLSLNLDYLDEIMQKAKSDLKGVDIGYIYARGANVGLFGTHEEQGFLYSEFANYAFYDTNASLVKTQLITKASLGDKILDSFRKSHIGYYNQITKFIWFLIGITPLMLSISGVYLWIKRTKFKRSKK